MKYTTQLFTSLVLGFALLFGNVSAATEVAQVRTALHSIAQNADTSPVVKGRLGVLAHEACAFFDRYAHHQALQHFSLAHDSFLALLDAFGDLVASDGTSKKVCAYHMRRLAKRAQALIEDLDPYVAQLEAYNVQNTGFGQIDASAIQVLKNLRILCQRLADEFFKEEYFLPLTPYEIFMDLVHYPLDFARDNKLIAGAVALCAWEFIGCQVDPDHTSTYSRPLSSAYKKFFGKEGAAEGNEGPGDDSSDDDNGGENLEPKKNGGKKQKDPLELFKDAQGNIIPLAAQNEIRTAMLVPNFNRRTFYDKRGDITKSRGVTRLVVGFIPADQAAYDLQDGESLQQAAGSNACGEHSLWNSYCLLTDTDRMNDEERVCFVDTVRLLVPAEFDGGAYLCVDHLIALIEGREIGEPLIRSQDTLESIAIEKTALQQKYENDQAGLQDDNDKKNNKKLKEQQIALRRVLDKKEKALRKVALRNTAENQVKIAAFREKARQLVSMKNQFAIIAEQPVDLLNLYYADLENFPYRQNIEEFKAGVPQVLIVNVGGHYITLRLELLSEEGAQRPRVTVYDSIGSHYPNHPIIQTVLYLFTRNMPYQMGVETRHEFEAPDENFDLDEASVNRLLEAGGDFLQEYRNNPVYLKVKEAKRVLDATLTESAAEEAARLAQLERPQPEPAAGDGALTSSPVVNAGGIPGVDGTNQNFVGPQSIQQQ